MDAVSLPEELLQRQLRESQYNGTQNTSLSGTVPSVFETKVAGSEATPSDSETKVVGSEDTPSLGLASLRPLWLFSRTRQRETGKTRIITSRSFNPYI